MGLLSNGIDSLCTLVRKKVYRAMQHMLGSENKIIACFNDNIVTRKCGHRGGNVSMHHPHWMTRKQSTGVGFVKQLAPDYPALSD